MSRILWLASYPKSGNTWLRLLLDSYFRSGDDVDINQIGVSVSIHARENFDNEIGVSAADLTGPEILAWRPSAVRKLAERQTDPIFCKTHNRRFQLLDGDWVIPADVSLGAVYLVRDPRDVAISLARFWDASLDETIALMAKPDLCMSQSISDLKSALIDPCGSWSQNVESWLSPEPFPAACFRYEDLRQDAERVFGQILASMGFAPDRAAVRLAVEATKLERLRRQETEHGFREAVKGRRFFGEGAIGGWRSALSAAQIARIEAAHAPVMRKLGYLVDGAVTNGSPRSA